ncbi:MAG: class I SAM-dependent methyltransferase [Candidatus Gracilibacteria bacterium]|jgi:SAM-dependent methyltransferase
MTTKEEPDLIVEVTSTVLNGPPGSGDAIRTVFKIVGDARVQAKSAIIKQSTSFANPEGAEPLSLNSILDLIPPENRDEFYTYVQFSTFFVSFDDDLVSLEMLRSLSVIDLGCGNEYEAQELARCASQSHQFQPWLCRALHALGVDVTGVDYRYPKRVNGKRTEDWKFLQANLKEPNALSGIASNSADIIYSNSVFQFGGNKAPSLEAYGDKENQDIEDEIFQQALRILKHGGRLNIDMNVYEKSLAPDGLYFHFKWIKGKPLPKDYCHLDTDALIFE